MKKLQSIIKKINFKQSIFMQIILILISIYILFAFFVDKIKLLYIIPVLIINFIIIIINVLNRKKLEEIFVLFALFLGSMYLILQLPSYKPDEYHHLFRAYDILKLNFRTKKDKKNVSKIKVPKNYIEQYGIKTPNYKTLVRNIKKKANYKEEEYTYSTAASNTFAPYFISNFGLGIAKIFNLNYLLSIYLSRLSNFIFYLILGYYSIKIIPTKKLIVFICLLNPMFLMQTTAVTADATLNSIAVLYFCYIIYLKYNKKNVNKKEIFILNIMILIMSLCKFVYAPLFLLQFILFNKKNIKENILRIIPYLILDIICVLVLCFYNNNYNNPSIYNYSNMSYKNVILHPINYLITLFNTFEIVGAKMTENMVGNYANWYDLESGSLACILYLVLCFISTIMKCKDDKNEKNIIKNYDLLIILGIVIIIFNLIFLGFYKSYFDTVLNIISGVQGRYFIPLLPLLLMFISKTINGTIKENKYLIYIIICYCNLSLLLNIVKMFAI